MSGCLYNIQCKNHPREAEEKGRQAFQFQYRYVLADTVLLCNGTVVKAIGHRQPRSIGVATSAIWTGNDVLRMTVTSTATACLPFTEQFYSSRGVIP